MKNYSKTNVSGGEQRIELHDELSLSGAEISVNVLPAGASVPFVHSHKQNEEIYVILEGNGTAVINGEKVEITANDYIRISPAAKRQFSAAPDSSLKYICIQVKTNSLEGYTANDAVIY
ncbi:MAG: cupin domain-containing protein [Bacteroides sp.]|nr:cupin domain-containing protein [Prevotella sp.]MCM1407817.1 cupin domain-containing protein [Treponema brennaborense]MCM1470870.1 cupin domain-containing protein [Bacteroides sp.]